MDHFRFRAASSHALGLVSLWLAGILMLSRQVTRNRKSQKIWHQPSVFRLLSCHNLVVVESVDSSILLGFRENWKQFWMNWTSDFLPSYHVSVLLYQGFNLEPYTKRPRGSHSIDVLAHMCMYIYIYVYGPYTIHIFGYIWRNTWIVHHCRNSGEYYTSQLISPTKNRRSPWVDSRRKHGGSRGLANPNCNENYGCLSRIHIR